MFSWSLRNHNNVAQSTAEVEYVAAEGCANQVIWLRMRLEDMGEKQLKSTEIFYFNKSAIAIAKNPI